MLDFGKVPPEVNSTRMYSGPGLGPLLAAAAAWDELAAGLESASRGFSTVISGLSGQNWSGSAWVAMAGAAAPYAAWMTATSVRAEHTASQARAAAAAYETAFAASVPPVEVTANRIRFATLVDTNIFGQNTTMIAATEATYGEMWAQDASAMYAYAHSSATASILAPFTPPPRTTNPAGPASQAAARIKAAGTSTTAHSQKTLSQLISIVPQQLQALSAGRVPSPPAWWSGLLTVLADFNSLMGPLSLASNFSRTSTSAGSFLNAVSRSAGQASQGAANAVTQAVTTGTNTWGSGGVRSQVLASAGEAVRIGKMSAPQSWAAATPMAHTVNEPLWLSEADLEAVPSWEANSATSMLGTAPMAGTGPMAGIVSRPTVSNVLRVGARRFAMPRPPVGG